MPVFKNMPKPKPRTPVLPLPKEDEENILDICTRSGVERILIEKDFTGQVVLHFNNGGFAGADKSIKVKIK